MPDVKAGTNRVVVQWDGDAMREAVDGVRNLYPEWQANVVLRGTVTDVGPFRSAVPMGEVPKHPAFTRSRALGKFNRNPVNWTSGTAKALLGLEVIFSFMAVVDWLTALGVDTGTHTWLARADWLPVKLVHVVAYSADQGLTWTGGSERLVEATPYEGVCKDANNYVYLLHQGPLAPLDSEGMHPPLHGLNRVEEYQVLASAPIGKPCDN